MQVLGTLKAKNTHIEPYEMCCSACHRPLPFDTCTDLDSVDCTYCARPTKPTWHHRLLCTLQRQEGSIDCTLQADMLKQHFPEITAISYEQYQNNISKMVYELRKLQLYGTFTLAVNNTIVKIVKH